MLSTERLFSISQPREYSPAACGPSVAQSTPPNSEAIAIQTALHVERLPRRDLVRITVQQEVDREHRDDEHDDGDPRPPRDLIARDRSVGVLSDPCGCA